MILDYSTQLPPPPNPPPGLFLRVVGTNITNDQDAPILLRGCGLGGWMAMQSFITGFPGHEVRYREAMLTILGPEQYSFWFDRYLYHFFNEKDARLVKSLGLNCIRIPLDYRHFEDDMEPMVLKHAGFKHLDRIISTCARYEIYTILELHAVPGGQNPSWHSNNIVPHAAFWDHKHFQDRAIWLWQKIADRYKDNPWVAGYNPINEPADQSYRAKKLIAWYKRVERAIREVDEKHILFFDANIGTNWFGFEDEEDDGKAGKRKAGIFANSAYICRDYCYNFGFPGSERYKGTPEQKRLIRNNYEQKVAFMKRNGLCIWNAEFGPGYANEQDDGPEWQEINYERMAMLKFQLEIYDEEKVSWSIWSWKDIGLQGITYLPQDSPYMRLIHPWLEKKSKLMLDERGSRPQPEIEALFRPLEDWINNASPSARYMYPLSWGTTGHLARAVRGMYLSESLQGEFAGYFDAKNDDELEELARSFSLQEEGEGKGGSGWAVQRGYLNEVLRDHNGKRACN